MKSYKTSARQRQRCQGQFPKKLKAIAAAKAPASPAGRANRNRRWPPSLHDCDAARCVLFWQALDCADLLFDFSITPLSAACLSSHRCRSGGCHLLLFFLHQQTKSSSSQTVVNGMKTDQSMPALQGGELFCFPWSSRKCTCSRLISNSWRQPVQRANLHSSSGVVSAGRHPQECSSCLRCAALDWVVRLGCHGRHRLLGRRSVARYLCKAGDGRRLCTR